MADLIIGSGDLAGKGVYANRDFKKDERVVPYHLHHVNHSPDPNTYQDFLSQGDFALRNISKGEMITTDASKDDV